MEKVIEIPIEFEDEEERIKNDEDLTEIEKKEELEKIAWV